MRSSSCLPTRDSYKKPPYWMNEGGLGLKTTNLKVSGSSGTSAVSGFRQVIKAKSEKFFFAASAFGQHRKFPPHSRNTSGT